MGKVDYVDSTGGGICSYGALCSKLHGMKRSELLFNFLLVPVDAAAILLAFAVAYFLRSQGEVVEVWPFALFFSFAASLLPIWIAIFGLEGLYNIRHARRGLDEFAGITIGALSGIMLVVGWLFLSRTFFFSRLVILYALALVIVFVTLGRWFVRALQKWLYRYGIGIHRIAFIGCNDTTYTLTSELTRDQSLGYKVVGVFTTPREEELKQDSMGLHILGSIESFVELAKKHAIDEVVITDPRLGSDQRLSIIEACEQERIDFRETPSFVGVRTLLFDLADLNGVPILEYRRTPLDGWGRIAKRFIDIFLSSIGLIVLSPFLLIMMLIIWVDDPGSVFYRNQRIGENAQPFETIKFRTMKLAYCTGAQYGGQKALEYEKELIEEKNTRSGALYKIKNDPRVTRSGHWIRRYSIDEFPQLWNVLVGEMSLVGPRPHQPREVAKYEPWHKKLFSVKPGMTGLAAVSGRSDLDFDDEARLDIGYIETWSFWEDFKVVLRTPLAVIKPRKVL